MNQNQKSNGKLLIFPRLLFYYELLGINYFKYFMYGYLNNSMISNKIIQIYFKCYKTGYNINKLFFIKNNQSLINSYTGNGRII